MTVGLDPCVIVQTPDQWATTRLQLRQLNSASEQARQFVRTVTSTAERTNVDKQGRISIPAVHRDYAGLTDKVVAVGVDNRVELWNAMRWDQSFSDGLSSLKQLSEQFGVEIL